MFILNLIAAVYLHKNSIISNNIYILSICEILTSVICILFLHTIFITVKDQLLKLLTIILFLLHAFNFVYSGTIINTYEKHYEINTNLYNMSIAIMVTNSIGLIGWAIVGTENKI